MEKTITPIRSGLLAVSKLHQINYAVFGNPRGIPLLSFHGGPGGSFKAKYAAGYGLDKFMVIMFDQRGCGGSAPRGEIRDNNADNTLRDAAALLDFLKVKKCVVVGASYGSTCALAFAEKYPARVQQVLVSSVFIPVDHNKDWFFGAVRRLFPKQYDQYIKVVRTEDAMQVWKKFEAGNHRRKQEITAATNNFERVSMKGINQFSGQAADDITDEDLADMRIYLHYAAKDWFGIGKSIMKNSGKLKNIPVRIIHGELDFCCPPVMAWDLYKKIPHADFTFVPHEGHYGTMLMELFHRSLRNV